MRDVFIAVKVDEKDDIDCSNTRLSNYSTMVWSQITDSAKTISLRLRETMKSEFYQFAS